MDSSTVKLRILCIDDYYGSDADGRDDLIRALSNDGPLTKWCDLTFCSGQTERSGRRINDVNVALEAVGRTRTQAGGWNLVLLDSQFLSGELSPTGTPVGHSGDDLFGDKIRRELLNLHPNLPVVMLTSKKQSELTNQDDSYLSKARLNARILKLAALRHGRLSLEERRELLELDAGTIVHSESMFRVYEEAYSHARSGIRCLLLGETGVGKERLAQYIHDRSGRSGKYIRINIAERAPNLVESELFGHEKGAFTGAVAPRAGHFEEADRGSLLIDEVGDLSLEAQSKLLRVLEDGEVRRLGAGASKNFDVRVIAATSKDLDEMVATGSFRADLLGRIRGVELYVPPLRERRDDIAPLAQAALTRFQAEVGKVGICLSEKALEVLRDHQFPGNVRDVENLVRRLVNAAGNNQTIGEGAVSKAISPKDQKARTAQTVAREGKSAWAIGAASHGHREAGDDSAETANAGTSGRTKGHLSLADVPEILDSISVDSGEASLHGFQQRAEAAFNRLLLRAAGAALERCRDPLGKKEFNLQKAMRYLSGNETLRTNDPKRTINKLLDRKSTGSVEQSDLNEIVENWRKTEK
jgi:transcriptional regulator with GAF, ATPase, and Fis domain